MIYTQSSSQTMHASPSRKQSFNLQHIQQQTPICNSLDSIMKKFGKPQNNSMPNLAANQNSEQEITNCGKIYSVVSSFLQNNLEKLAFLNNSKSAQIVKEKNSTTKTNNDRLV